MRVLASLLLALATPALACDIMKYKRVKASDHVTVFEAAEGTTAVVTGNIVAIAGRDATLIVDTGQLPSVAQRVIGELPRVVATAAELREPHRVARYLEDLAGTYHRFYDSCRILPRGDEEVGALTIARLWLNAATRQVIENGLGLLGVTAPERM